MYCSRSDIEQQIEAGKFADSESSKKSDYQPRLLSKPKEYSVNFNFPEVIDESPCVFFFLLLLSIVLLRLSLPSNFSDISMLPSGHHAGISMLTK